MEKLQIRLRDELGNTITLELLSDGNVRLLDEENVGVMVFTNELEVDLFSDTIKNLLKSK